MTHFLATNWILIVLIGAMVLMRSSNRHGRQMGGMGGGCGGGHLDHGHDDDGPSHAEERDEHAILAASKKSEKPGDESSVSTTATDGHRGC